MWLDRQATSFLDSIRPTRSSQPTRSPNSDLLPTPFRCIARGSQVSIASHPCVEDLWYPPGRIPLLLQRCPRMERSYRYAYRRLLCPDKKPTDCPGRNITKGGIHHRCLSGSHGSLVPPIPDTLNGNSHGSYHRCHYLLPMVQKAHTFSSACARILSCMGNYCWLCGRRGRAALERSISIVLSSRVYLLYDDLRHCLLLSRHCR